MARLLSKANLTAHVAPDENGRYATAGLILAEDGVWSTDGRILVRTPYPRDEPTEHPQADDEAGPTDVVVPLQAAQKVVKNLPRGRQARPALEHAAVTLVEGKLKLGLGLRDEGVTVTDRPGLTFPSLDKIRLKFGRTGTHARFDLHLLKQLVTVLEKAGASFVDLDLEADGPLLVFGQGVDNLGDPVGEVARGMIVPIRFSTRPKAPPPDGR